MLANYVIIGVDKSEVRVFIWTISDIAAVIIFIFFVVAAICAFIPARTGSRQSERKAATHNERQKEAAKRDKNIPWWWYVIAGIILYAFIGFVLPVLLH
jgi:heme/copper-type cytochrome/quinol oxidase subunit 2